MAHRAPQAPLALRALPVLLARRVPLALLVLPEPRVPRVLPVQRVLPVPRVLPDLQVLPALLELQVPLAPRAMAWLSRDSMPPCRSCLLHTQPALLAKPSW